MKTVKVSFLTLITVCLLTIVAQQSRAETLLREDFNTDVIGSGDWTTSDGSVYVDTENGWLRIGSNGAVDDYAEKSGSFPLPLVIEWRERTYDGDPGTGPYFSLPKLEFYWGPAGNESYHITYVDVDNTGLGGWLLGHPWTNILTLGPTNWNQWRTVKAIIRSDGGELFAKEDGDLDFTPIVSVTWAIPNVIQRFRLSQNSDDVSDFDYVQVTPYNQQTDGWCDGFEGGLVNWNPYQYPSGWTATTSNPHSGQTCAAFTFPSGAGYYDASMLSTTGLFNVEAGITYRVTYWIREQNTRDTWDPNASILDMNLIDGGANNRIAPFLLPISSEWYFVDGTVTASVSGPASIDVQLHGYATSSDAVFAIDDICVTPMPTVQPVALDIKPGSCPNPLNVKETGNTGDNGDDKFGFNSGGDGCEGPKKNVLPVAIMGNADLDVTAIDVTSIRLAGIAPLRSNYEDVGAPIAQDVDDCSCSSAGPDGFADLTLKFDKASIVAALGPVEDGMVVPMTLTGSLLDGTPIQGHDCVTIVGANRLPIKNRHDERSIIPTAFALGQNHPNPFNPATEIAFALPDACDTKLEIFNVLGQKVATLADGYFVAGEYLVTWDASTQASGVYFYRLTTGEFVATEKMILLK